MGGCAGKFKGSDDLPPEPLPSDAPVNPDQAEGETVAKEEEVGDVKTEAPLVDVSEQKQEEDKVEAPAEPGEERGDTLLPKRLRRRNQMLLLPVRFLWLPSDLI
ncbi:hypothetical protein OIU84_007614 [Salix udensis]|uniref:Uncharacterized protein n=1 Tax=Salix udensis TaxID=889485 RepID=A0AAD6JV42_9ROSI|nr:hypothetical protein OIU84_007614 [Salix udensis]